MMDSQPVEHFRRVLVASANPLFGKGLQKLLVDRWGPSVEMIGLTSTLDETLAAIEAQKPDLVIVDYDDKAINRMGILSHFVAGEHPMQVVLVSLRGSGEVVVYDRHTLSPSEAEDFFTLPRISQSQARLIKLPQPGQLRHLITVIILIPIVALLTYLGLSNARILPVGASVQAGPIDAMFNFHFIAISFLFALIVVFLLYSVFVWRRKKGDASDSVHRKGNNVLEAVWTALPLITVLTVSYVGAQNLADTTRQDPQAMVVNVIGGQWFWSFEYPDYGFSSQTLNLPVNRQVLLRMTSRDVIHSFWVPEFRVKQDLLPGENMIKELRITPTMTGDFKVRCAEMCGVSHAYMESPVIVMDQASFDTWIQEQANQVMDDPIARGQRWVSDNGCTGCHSLDGSASVGPTWKGLFGSQVPLADGSTVVADEAYLREAILNPQSQVHQGFAPNLMPDIYENTLSDEQIQDIIAFIQSVQ